MRKVTYGGACSADGYITGADEAIDWLRWSDDSAKLSAESFKGVDTMLVGRKTFEVGQRMGGGPKLKGVKTYVFSRTLGRLPDGADGELVSEDVAEFVRRLKAEPGGDLIVMGGGEIGTALIDAGLVNEVGFSIHPVLLGGGTRAFAELSRRVELELIEARTIAEGCVFVRWRVVV